MDAVHKKLVFLTCAAVLKRQHGNGLIRRKNSFFYHVSIALRCGLNRNRILHGTCDEFVPGEIPQRDNQDRDDGEIQLAPGLWGD